MNEMENIRIENELERQKRSNRNGKHDYILLYI